MTNEELNSLQSEAYDHLWNGRFRLALAAAEKVYEYRPDDSDAAICLAWAYLENGNPTKAIDFANIAVEMKGNAAKTRFFRAYLLTRMGIYEGAQADIDSVILKEKSLLSWTYLTKARAHAGQKKFDEANKYFSLGLLIDGGDNPSWSNSRKWFQQAPVIFAPDYKITKNNVEEIIQLAKEALKAKEYWFALLAAQKILEENRFSKEYPELLLLELEAMYLLFQYKPAFKKAEKIKSLFKDDTRFKQIYQSLQKLVFQDEMAVEKSSPQRKTITETQNLKLPGRTPSIEFKSSPIYYPNDYADIVSIRIFDSLKDLKQQKRIYYKEVDRKFTQVGVEVIFNNLFFKKEDQTFSCKAVWYLNDVEIGINTFRLNIPSDWDSVIFTQSISTSDSEYWKVGQGKVEIYINFFKVGERYFGVNELSIVEEEITPKQKTVTQTKQEEQKVEKQKPVADTRPLAELLDELESYVGLQSIKQSVRDFISYLEFIQERKKYGLKTDDRFSVNTIFLGNPGTGKTTIARLLGGIFRAMGILPLGHVVEVDRAALVGQYIGETAQKTEKIISDAIGGLLFIDEAYTLIKKGGSGQDFGQEAIDVLLKRMEDRKGEFVVIAAGYSDEMQAFLNSNPGLKSRFSHTFVFEDYTPEEMLQIFHRNLKKEEYKINPDAEEALRKELQNLYRKRDKSFGNARLIKNIFEEAKINLGKRVLALSTAERTRDTLNTITIEDISLLNKKPAEKKVTLSINEELLNESLAELDKLVGLTSVKKEINDLVKLARYFAEQGEDLRDKFWSHYLFLGNPGTGKTTVARIFSKIFSALGVLTKGHLVETDRQGLVAGFVGQTAEKTTALIDKAIGGTLFIDEAYSLIKSDGSGSDFGKEAIDILLKRMEDDRGKFIVIAAGYTEEMKAFIASNPGMESRFGKSITFEDYTPDELLEIVYRAIAKEKKILSPEAEGAFKNYFARIYLNRDRKFGNARIVRNLLESVKQKMLLRIADLPASERTEEKLSYITLEDVRHALAAKGQASDYRVKGDPLKLQEYIDELNSLVGLEEIKEGIFRLISGSKIAQLKRERGLQVIDKNLNGILFGKRGTGKKTVLKILSKIMKELGLIEKDKVIIVKRADLVGSYPEQTIRKTEEVIKNANGGIMLIEDAYTLIKSEDDSGLDAVDTLISKMEEGRHKFVVYLSGPVMETIAALEKYHPLKSRFHNHFYFEDYTPRQLLSIAFEMADNLGYVLDEGALQSMLDLLNEIYEKKDENFGNAHIAKNLIYQAISNQEQRIASLANPTDDDLKTIIFEDINSISFNINSQL